jgi:peptidyl-prolyl cis-trans isomerase SurA
MDGSLKMIKNKAFIYLFCIFIIFNQKCVSLENKILVKIENEIISTVDVNNESKYLITLNKSIQKLNQKEIFELSKKSIIREKIKTIEIHKNFINPKIPDKFLEKILKNVYQKLEINDLNSFKEYLKTNNVDYEYVKDKIQTEALWNELIVKMYSSKIKINVDEIKQSIVENNNKASKSYLLSEITFEISNTKELDSYLEEIKRVIKDKGFSNTALTYSTSSTSSIGGQLDWIEEDSLNKNLKDILSKMKKNEITNPITVPGGFLILKIDDIKKIKKNKNIEQEIKKVVNIKRNIQLNQFSKMYFNKVKNNIQINEL